MIPPLWVLAFDRLPMDLLARLRDRRLRAVVRHAWERVPFYRARFAESGVTPADIGGLADLARLPLTTKEDLRAAGEAAILARGFDPAQGTTVFTSGTTGVPLRVHRRRREARYWGLTEFRCQRAVGRRAADRLVILGPVHHAPRRPFHRLGIYPSQVILGTVPVREQARQLRRARPDVLWGYPASLAALLETETDELGLAARPRVIITSAQTLEDALRERLRHAFGAEVFDFYGAMEVGRIAAECRCHQGLHVMADAVVVECLAGDRPAAPGEPGRVVVTSLVNRAMPFIRYQLGDLAAPLAGPCPCGSPLPRITAPSGREPRLFRLPSGSAFSVPALEFLVRRHMWLHRFRFEQAPAGALRLELEPGGAVPAGALDDLRADILTALGEPVSLTIEVGPRHAADRQQTRSLEGT